MMDSLGSAFASVAGVLSLALFLSLVNERVNEFVLRPIVAAILKATGKPEWTGKAMPYVAGATALAISLAFGLDLFAPLAEAVKLHPPVWATLGLTALVVAGGSNLLHDIWPGQE